MFNRIKNPTPTTTITVAINVTECDIACSFIRREKKAPPAIKTRNNSQTPICIGDNVNCELCNKKFARFIHNSVFLLSRLRSISIRHFSRMHGMHICEILFTLYKTLNSTNSINSRFYITLYLITMHLFY